MYVLIHMLCMYVLIHMLCMYIYTSKRKQKMRRGGTD